MKNPILDQREKLSLTRRAFCVTYDVPISCQSGAELGHVTTIPKSVLQGLRKAGVAEDIIEKLPCQYKTWLKAVVRDEMKAYSTGGDAA